MNRICVDLLPRVKYVSTTLQQYLLNHRQSCIKATKWLQSISHQKPCKDDIDLETATDLYHPNEIFDCKDEIAIANACTADSGCE